MAKDDELELDVQTSPKGGKGKLIAIIAVAVLLTTSILIGVLYFTGGLGSSNSASAGKAPDKHGKGAKEEQQLVIKPAFYYDLQPAFVVNFEDQTNAAYLQIEMQAMSYDKEVNNYITKHMPVIRNNILLILSAAKFEEVKTRTGKEALQKKVLEAIRKIVGDAILAERTKEGELKEGEALPNVEQIYFTSFIMQ